MTGIVDQEYRMTPAAELIPHPDNPNRGDIGTISESVEVNGFYGTIVAQKSTGYVLAGNHRLLVAQAHGIETLPVMWVDVDDAGATRILVEDNRSSEKSEWDERRLAEVLGGLDDPTLGTGFTQDEFANLLRTTGLLGEAASAFTDGLLGEDGDGTDPDSDDGPVQSSQPGSYYTLAYTVNAPQRETILTALRTAKNNLDLPTTADALAAICKDWLDAPAEAS